MKSLEKILRELQLMRDCPSINCMDTDTINHALHYLEEYEDSVEIVEKDTNKFYPGKAAFDEKVQKRLAALNAEVKGV